MEYLRHALILGIGATAVMDTWGIVRQPLLGLPRLDPALIGRWIGHMAAGQFRHEAIRTSPPVRGERLIGWTMHYLIGTGFAGLLLWVWGLGWLDRPTLGPALVVGIGTVAAPLLVMQPAMGVSRARHPGSARLQSVISHATYGLGLYLAGWADHLVFTP